jgi:hypothetical protein
VGTPSGISISRDALIVFQTSGYFFTVMNFKGSLFLQMSVVDTITSALMSLVWFGIYVFVGIVIQWRMKILPERKKRLDYLD